MNNDELTHKLTVIAGGDSGLVVEALGRTPVRAGETVPLLEDIVHYIVSRRA